MKSKVNIGVIPVTRNTTKEELLEMIAEQVISDINNGLFDEGKDKCECCFEEIKEEPSKAYSKLNTPRKLAEEIVAVVESSGMDKENKEEAMELAFHMAFGSHSYHWLINNRGNPFRDRA